MIKPDGRARERDQLSHVADAIRAHLDHRAAMRGLEAHQRQRHADVIVEVAVGRHARAPARQDRRRHLLGGGLAVAAADRRRWGWKIPRATPRASCCSAAQRVRHHDLRQRHRGQRPIDDGAHRAARRARRRRIRAPSKFGPRSATNSAPAVQRAAVGRHRAVGPIIARSSRPPSALRRLAQACASCRAASQDLAAPRCRSLKLRRVAP